MVGGSFQLTIIGFEHTAFIFSHESMIDQVKVEDDQVKPGALISLLQKSLQYMELEAHVNDVMKFETVAHSVEWRGSGLHCSVFFACAACVCFWKARIGYHDC